MENKLRSDEVKQQFCNCSFCPLNYILNVKLILDKKLLLADKFYCRGVDGCLKKYWNPPLVILVYNLLLLMKVLITYCCYFDD